MNAYKISCYSKCGTYFASYLQSVTVLAESEAEAIQKVEDWLDHEGRTFLNSDSSKWTVEKLAADMCGVIDWHEDSDY